MMQKPTKPRRGKGMAEAPLGWVIAAQPDKNNKVPSYRVEHDSPTKIDKRTGRAKRFIKVFADRVEAEAFSERMKEQGLNPTRSIVYVH